MRNIQKLVIRDLEKSGLRKEHIKKLKLKSLKQEETKKITGKSLTAYKIPYFEITGKVSSFFRVRYLEQPSSFAGAGKKIRYSQPENTDPHLYFPPLLSWKEILKDVDTPLIITEGEKKAAKACEEGLATIGLGGVWSFRSKKKRKSLIEDFYKIQWENRNVELIFDSDLKDNPNVSMALSTLAKELTNLGAIVYIRFLPPGPDGEKVGLDDFLIENGPEELEELESEEYILSSKLWDLNEEIAVLEEPPSIFQFKTGILTNKEILVGTIYSDRHITVEIDNKLKKLNAASEWMKWPCRRVHRKLVYEPGKDLIIPGKNYINSWKGWGCEPKRGNIKLWDELLEFLFSKEKGFKEWFMKWLAYPIQYPGTKLYTCVLVHGRIHGTGKSFIGEIMSKIYGENYQEVGEEDLHSQFNEWCVGKQFIMGEEITGSNSRKEADRIKRMITRTKITVNVKFQPQHIIRDCINYYLNSNRPDAWFVEQSDRRVAVCEVPNEKLSLDFYRRLNEWKNGDGPAALFYHLLHRVNLKDFYPLDPSPETRSKENMRLISMSDIDMFLESMRVDPDSLLRFDRSPIDRDLFTIEEIVKLYDYNGEKRTSNIAMSKSLRRFGFPQLAMTKTSTGSKRLYALRNCKHWEKASHGQRCANYEGSLVFMKGKKSKFVKNQ